MIRSTALFVILLLAASAGIGKGSTPVLGSGAGRVSGDSGSATIVVGQTLTAGTAGEGVGSVQLGFWPAFRYRGLVPVHLAGFALSWEHSGVTLRWDVIGEPFDHAGFHVHRAADDGAREQITPALLSGATSYTVRDPSPPPGRLQYWLAEHSRSGGVTWYGPLELLVEATTLRLALLPNSPNPFHAATTIGLQIPAAEPVRLAVFDTAGRRVAVLLDEWMEPGAYEVSWRGMTDAGRRAGAGTYFYRLDTPSGSRVGKLTLLP